MELSWLPVWLVLGAVTGVFAGLMGVGGGGILVPMLTTLFTMQGFPPDVLVHMALGTSMATIVFTSLSSLRAHHAHGAVDWKIVRTIIASILLATFATTFFAANVPARPLSIFFACFMAYVSWQMIQNRPPKPGRVLPGAAGLSAVGAAIGAVSALVAIGGGSLVVPFLIWCNVRAQTAIGTSAAIGLPIAFAGSVGYLINGWSDSNMPPGSLGFIYLPALFSISLASMLTAPLGARLAHRLPVAVLKKVFAVVLLLLSAKMLWMVFSSG